MVEGVVLSAIAGRLIVAAVDLVAGTTGGLASGLASEVA